MFSSAGRYFAGLLLGVAFVLPLRSEEKPPAKLPATIPLSNAEKKSATAKDNSKSRDAKKWNPATFPADAVVLVCERLADALQMIPNAVILTPAKYQKLLDEIERLRKLLQTDKPQPPTSCHLQGKVEDGAVRLEAVFGGSTDRANRVIFLACPQAGAAPSRDANTVQDIRQTDSGEFLARIEKAGDYQIKLNLFVPLRPREGNGRGFELTLPHAAVTDLDLDLPANSKDVRVGGQPLSDPDRVGLKLKGHHLSGCPSVNAVDKLDLTWKEMRPSSGVAVRSAAGDIRVRLDPSGLTTETVLTLSIEGASTNEWRLLVPLGAEVKVDAADAARVQTKVDTEKRPFAWLRTIHLKKTSAEPLHVHIKAHAPLPRGGSVVAIGPFFVMDAVRQTGTVVVKNQLRHLRLFYHGHGDLTQRRVAEESAGDGGVEVAQFTYGDIPLVDKPKSATGPTSLSWLDLEAETVRGQVRTRVTHTLTLRSYSPSPPTPLPRSGGEGSRSSPLSPLGGRGVGGEGEGEGQSLYWDLVTTIVPVSKWPEGEQLKVVVSPDWTANNDGVAVTTDGKTRSVIYPSHVLRRDPTQEIKVPGRYNQPCQAEGRAALKLPRPLGLVEQCEVKIEVGGGSEVFLHNAATTDLEAVGPARPNQQAWRCRHLLPPDWPALDVSWRPYRPKVPATSLVDVNLNGNRAEVRQEWHLRMPQTPPTSFRLRLPSALDDSSLRIVDSDKLQSARDVSEAVKDVLLFKVPASAGGRDCRLLVNYTLNLEDTNKQESRDRKGAEKTAPLRSRLNKGLQIPLVIAEQTSGAVKVRIWTMSNRVPRLVAGSAWDQRSIEEVEGRDWPVLVAQTSRSDAPLRLRIDESSAKFSVLVERALVRVQLLKDGGQWYRASFQLRQLSEDYLDVQLPGPVAALDVHIALNGRNVKPVIVDEAGRSSGGGDVARLRLGRDLIRQLAVLEVSYRLPPGRGIGGALRSVLQPPFLTAAPPLAPTRWMIALPSDRVLLAPENDASLERTWTRCGWLLAASPKSGAVEVEREFDKWLPPKLHLSARLDAESQTPMSPALVCWQNNGGSLTLTHAPRQAWLLVCSLGLLILGLGMHAAARPRRDGSDAAVWIWPLLILAMLAVLAGVLVWPTTLWAVVYGCQPGAVVLLAAIVFHWLVQQRYRRQIVFLPSFSRGRAGSSLLRKSAPPRPRSGEPSTVDAPPPAE